MFIVIEGVDFSGKTTLAKELHQHTVSSWLLHEPGSSALANDVRTAMKTHRMDIEARQLLMHGCRLDMLANHPIEDPDRLYIIDRYVLSTLVYGSTDGVAVERLQRMIELFPVPVPVVTLIIMPQWTTIQVRSMERDGLDALEGSMGRLFSIYSGYMLYAGLQPGDYYNIIDHPEKSYLEQALDYLGDYTSLTPFLL
jgi:thymidylate kinase